PDPIFVPTAGQILAGSVTFTLSAYPNNPCSFTAEDNMTIFIQSNPFVDAGPDSDITSGLTFELSDASSNGHHYGLLWSTNGDGSFNDPTVIHPIYTLGIGDVYNPSVELCIVAEPVNPCTIGFGSCMTLYNMLEKQIIEIPSGWSGLSGFLQPAYPDMEMLMAPVVDELIIIKNFIGFYYPTVNTNTLGDWNDHSGYCVKMTDPVALQIIGDFTDDTGIDLPAGWSIIPVLSICQVSVWDIFNQIPDDLILIKEVAGSAVFWPDMNIANLEMLEPGMAYYLLADGSPSFFYPQCDGSVKMSKPIEERIAVPGWTQVVKTPATHLIGMDVKPFIGNNTLEYGDIIGAFTQDGICCGTVKIDNNTEALTICGNDPTSDIKDGFDEGEEIRLRLFKPVEQSELSLQVEFDEGFPTTETVFTTHGLSVISHLKTGPLEVTDSREHGFFTIYPNPAKNWLYISLSDLPAAECKIQVVDIHGKLADIFSPIFTAGIGMTHKMDVSGLDHGIYFLQLISSENSIIACEKFIVN
nr:T9SS type A sorting domain-containing protein [Bacteroidota bacterium]